MIKTLSRFGLLHYRGLLTAFTVLVAPLVLPGSGAARAPHFSRSDVTQGWTAAGYPYMNGGISLDERHTMERMARPYNLKLVFARRAGIPGAPVFLLIATNNGRHIETISLSGPWFYIQLPPGSYTILARFARQAVLVRDVYLWEGHRKTYVVRGD
jgi:hypothetical protein